MKKILISNAFITLLFTPLIAFSQQISEIKTEGTVFNEGSSVKFEISFSGQGRCGLQFNFGDGSTSDIRVEDSSKPIVAIKSYPAKGAYKIEANGKALIRGLNSFTPCRGNAKIEIAIGANSEGTQKAESSTSAVKATAQTNTDQIMADAARAIAAETERKKVAEKEQAESQARLEAQAQERAKAAAEQARLADARAKEEQAKAKAAEQNLFKANADKGLAIARDSNVKFSLFKKRDEIQAKDLFFAKSDQANNGAKASTEVYCEKNDIVARIIITDASARLEKIGALGLRGVAAKARINGNPTELNILLETDAFANPKFSNVFKFTLGRNVDDHVGKREDVCSVPNFEKLDSMQVEYGNYNFLKNFPKRLCPAPIGTKVYRILGNYEAPKCENCKTEISLLNEIILQIPTNKGDLILKVPPFDPSISQIIKSCKSN